MKANELRIGNLVLNEYLDEKYVVRISPFNVHLSDSGDDDESVKQCKYNEIEPIPLTEEWLLKFGFDVNNRPKWLNHLSKYRFVCGTTRYLKGCENDSKPIEFVHQLQNLYFALTGEELLPIGGRLT